jgi:hypothetical protein
MGKLSQIRKAARRRGEREAKIAALRARERELQRERFGPSVVEQMLELFDHVEACERGEHPACGHGHGHAHGAGPTA